MKLKIFSGALVLSIVPCLSYYTMKFYAQKQLNFNSDSLTLWTIMMILILISLALNCYTVSKVNKITKQNQELKDLIVTLEGTIEENHYESLKYNQNTREIILDGFNEGS